MVKLLIYDVRERDLGEMYGTLGILVHLLPVTPLVSSQTS